MNAEILSEVISFKALVSNDLSELIKFSYIPVIKAIVPPETPGITLAIPMPIPLINSVKYCFIFYFFRKV